MKKDSILSNEFVVLLKKKDLFSLWISGNSFYISTPFGTSFAINPKRIKCINSNEITVSFHLSNSVISVWINSPIISVNIF